MSSEDFKRIIIKSFTRKGFTDISIEVNSPSLAATVSGNHPRLGPSICDCTIETDAGKDMLMVRFHGMEYGSWVDDLHYLF